MILSTPINVVADGFVSNDGCSPVGDGFWRAGLAAIASGDRRLVVPGGQYRATATVRIPSGLVVDWAPMAGVLVADWDRGPGEPAVLLTDEGEPRAGNGGRYTGLTVNSASGRSGGIGVQIDASGVAGAHYAVVTQLWVGYLNGPDGPGEWDWPLVLEGRHNDTAASGIRAVVVEYARLFAARHGYAALYRARACVLVRPGFYAPAAPAALGLQPSRGWAGVAAIDSSTDCDVETPDVG